ncbi:MAG TPA: adenylate/guanylate cyclase domain-containing protein, partial [Candidatus Limnocylindria bacterium]|nr:adenylate/guanylate cyclase domain-containing protein [Candidatus Limnocylindria bacterium]
KRVFVCERFPLLVGRDASDSPVDIDLSPDGAVSRRHGQITVDEEGFWFEDLGSRRGVLLNSREIRGLGRQRLALGDLLRVGETRLTVLLIRGGFMPAESSGPVPADPVTIGPSLPAAGSALLSTSNDAAALKRQALLLELPVAFAEVLELDGLLQRVLERAVSSLHGARRGTILLREREEPFGLRLTAYVSDGAPAISESLARRALETRSGFIWQRGVGTDVRDSITQLGIESGLYAPLVWQQQALGVICVDNPDPTAAFTEDDLKLLLVIAHYAAMAVANQQLQSELRAKTRVLERLLTSFSPRLRERLLHQARQGRLRPGGERSDVSILFSDMRGFTKLAAGMDAGEVLELLNEYFPAMVGAVFQHDGTLDKFVGDAVLAVFGSPIADPQHREKAVRAALAMQAGVRAVNERRRARSEPTCEIGIGVHCGEVIHGFVGANERLDYTVIGDAVNRASRYCSGAAAGEVLISAELYKLVFLQVVASRRTITTKHEGEFTAYAVQSWR